MVKLARAILTGTVLVLFAGFAGAQPPAAGRIAFAIDAPSLPDALNAWAQQAGLQLIWPSDERAAQFQVPRLVGTYTAESALQQLLQGSGLTYSFVDAHTVAIRRETAATAQRDPPKSGVAPPAASSRSRSAAGRRNASGQRPSDSLQAAAETLKEVVVTGSHIRGGNAASPVLTIGRVDIERTGYSTLAQLVQSFPQNFNNISDTTFGTLNGGDEGSLGNGSALNLRGLGGAATLVLLNGRRLVPSGDGSFVDLSLIPWVAVERVDVLTDGASAIYGSDAIGGVVNIILRDRFDGAETLARYGTVTQGDSAEYQLGQTVGSAWEGGSALLNYEYLRRTPLDAADRDFTKDVPGTLDLSPRQERHGAVAAFSQQVTPRIEVVSDLLFGTRNSEQIYSVLGPRTRQSASIDQFNGSLGANVELDAGWQLRAGSMYGGSHTRQESVAEGTPPSLFQYSSRAWSAEATADGPLARTGGGDVRLAAGVQWRNEQLKPEAFSGISTADELDRRIGVGYAELLVPVVGAGNRRPGIERLELTAAGRFEHYDDFGSTANPKFGVSWWPGAGVNLRGTYGTSFKAPLLSQLNPANLLPAAFDMPDPDAASGTTPVIVMFGSGVDLEPEQATTWTVGMDLAADRLPGFAAALTYFNIRFTGRIATPIPDDDRLFTALGEPLYAPFVDLDPDTATVNALFAHPRFVNFSSATGTAQIGAVVDARLVNLVEQHLQGIDALLSYRFATAAGDFSIQLSGNYLFDGGKKILPGTAEIGTLNSVFNPVDLRLRNSVEWTQRALTVTLAVNYTDSYRDDRLGAGGRRTVASWTTFDCTLQYEGGESWRDTDVTLAALNIFDRDPPFIASDINLHFDGANSSPLGRTVGVMVRKRW